tara:strand:- start:3801 stop:4394 length:594 start_codon:yes stop_codon:yes gene_type:complete
MKMQRNAFQREWLLNTKTYKASSTSCDTKHKIKAGIGYDANGYPADIIVGLDALEDTAMFGGYEQQNQNSHKIKITISLDGKNIIDTIHAGSDTNDGWNYYYYRINNIGKYIITIALDSWGSCAKPTTYSETMEYEMTQNDLTTRGESSGLDNRTEYERHEDRKDETKQDAKGLISMIGIIAIPLAIILALVKIRKG